MAGDKPNVQDTFLNEARKTQRPVRVLLCNGKELRGKVTSFDTFTLMLNANGMDVLIYKGAIAAIAPDATTAGQSDMQQA